MHKFCCFVFFFQAEDGIRDADVTGVQTCALPIWLQILAQVLLFSLGQELIKVWLELAKLIMLLSKCLPVLNLFGRTGLKSKELSSQKNSPFLVNQQFALATLMA